MSPDAIAAAAELPPNLSSQVLLTPAVTCKQSMVFELYFVRHFSIFDSIMQSDMPALHCKFIMS